MMPQVALRENKWGVFIRSLAGLNKSLAEFPRALKLECIFPQFCKCFILTGSV